MYSLFQKFCNDDPNPSLLQTPTVVQYFMKFLNNYLGKCLLTHADQSDLVSVYSKLHRMSNFFNNQWDDSVKKLNPLQSYPGETMIIENIDECIKGDNRAVHDS